MNKLGKAVLIGETIMVVGFISYVAGVKKIFCFFFSQNTTPFKMKRLRPHVSTGP